jgi:hypothetical protein
MEVEYHVGSWRVEFGKDFLDKFDVQGLQDICKKMEEKYQDFEDMMVRKYDDMRNTFVESNKKKMFAVIPSDSYLSFSHLEIMEDRYRFAAVLFTQGKGRKVYYKSI